MTVFSQIFCHPAKKAAVFAAAFFAVMCFSACETSNHADLSQISSSSSSEDSEISASEDPALQGEGTVSLPESLGSRQDGFAFADAAWFSRHDAFLAGLTECFPDLSGGLTAEYESGSSGVYLTAGMVQFSDYPLSACLRITETQGEVTACSYVFSFAAEEKESYIAAFLQAREMLTAAFGGGDEEIPAFDPNLPSGATWYGSDGSGLGMTDTSPDESSLQFEIVLSAPQARG